MKQISKDVWQFCLKALKSTFYESLCKGQNTNKSTELEVNRIKGTGMPMNDESITI